MISGIFCVLFGLSLLPGRKPLCIRFAERISDGIMPAGAAEYCRRLTWVWFGVLAATTVAFLVWGWWWAGCIAVPLTFAIERPIRNRRFRVVFHTSGSTGKSKTIVKPFDTLAKEVAMHREFYRKSGMVDDETMFIGTVDTSHMLGKLWLDLLPDAMGCRADKTIIRTPEELIEKMGAAKKVFLVTTPSFLERFTAYGDQYAVPQNTVEIVTSGSALAPTTSQRTKAVFGVEPRQIFGSTETGGVAWMRGKMMPRVFDGVQVRTRGEERRLAVKSAFSFRRGWYLMGDGAELSEDGRSFRLLGRRDRLVKINDERVNLEEMEQKVRAMGFADCACVALEGTHGAYLALALVSDEEISPLELRKRFLSVFPKGTVPRKYRILKEIPKNTQGKVLKSEIAKMF